MAYSHFQLSGTPIKNPTTFRRSYYLITNLERRADGMIVGDLISKKRKYYFTYDALSAADIDNFVSIIYDSNTLFHTLTYLHNGRLESAVVYSGELATELNRAMSAGSGWSWRNTTFNLIEQ